MLLGSDEFKESGEAKQEMVDLKQWVGSTSKCKISFEAIYSPSVLTLSLSTTSA